MCSTGVYPICIKHVYYTCNCYTYNTPKTPHITDVVQLTMYAVISVNIAFFMFYEKYYMCDISTHVICLKHQTCKATDHLDHVISVNIYIYIYIFFYEKLYGN